jgi:hypothetical protein
MPALGVAAASLVQAGCAGSRAVAGEAAPLAIERPAPQSDEHDAPRRHPDAVVLEPPSALPDAVARASARGVLALREPEAGDAVADLVQSVVDAWEHQSIEALVALLTLDAGPLDGRGRGRSALVEGWRQRMQAHAYGRLAGVELVRSDRIERWNWEDLGGAGAPSRPPDMRAGEVLVRAPVEVPRMAGERLFGDELVMVLRREEGKLRIAAYAEVDNP